MRYHYNRNNGKVYLCKASKKPCPLGADTLHENFKDAIAAQRWADKLNEEKFGKDLHTGISKLDEAPKSKLQLTKKYLPTEEREDLPFYQNQIISGMLRYSELNEESYREFGFEAMDAKGLAKRNRIEGPVEEETIDRMMLEDSKEKLKALSEDNKKSLNYYGSTGFQPVNRLIYNLKEFDKYYGNDPDKFHFTALKQGQSFIPYQKINRDFTKTVIQHMDEAVALAPKKQKIVYRGVTPDRIADDKTSLNFTKDPDDDESLKRYASRWVDTHRSLGTEIVMEGFSSSTATFNKAKEFSDDGGIVYEILTSEGANISAYTDYLDEREILLPRKQRYVVVGVHKNIEMETEDGPQTYHIIQLVGINSKGEILDGANSDPQETFWEGE